MDYQETFFDAMNRKFLEKGKEEGRSMQPWNDLSYHFLKDKLVDEYLELLGAWSAGKTDGIQEELVDLANLCMFLFLHLQDNPLPVPEIKW